MNERIKVSTPSRVCLFGEHQDYLGLSVIASAINLRFSAQVSKREDSLIKILIRDEKIDTLNYENSENAYQEYCIDLKQPILYKNNRDYLNSTVNCLLKNGYTLFGMDIKMDSEIPIGKGMCSSSTMIVVLIKAILSCINHPDSENAEKIAKLAFTAEVLEFNEPGGMMDHYTSAYGGLLRLNFNDNVEVIPLDKQLKGVFILFDSLAQKDTTKVLADSKTPTLEGLSQLNPYGIYSIKDFLNDENLQYVCKLDAFHAKKITANINNYKILLDAYNHLNGEESPAYFGHLLNEHHKNLKEGLGISTPKIDTILQTAIDNGAFGGKINGSGGGGCCFAYALEENAEKIMDAVSKLGYPSRILKQDIGVCKE